MNDSTRLFAAAVLGAVLTAAATTLGGQPPPIADCREPLEAEVARARSVSTLQSIDARLSEIERSLEQIRAHAR